MPVKTNIYIDGFNLYYGALKGSTHKWLDVKRLCELALQPHHVINRIRYFTANVAARPVERSAKNGGVLSRDHQANTHRCCTVPTLDQRRRWQNDQEAWKLVN